MQAGNLRVLLLSRRPAFFWRRQARRWNGGAIAYAGSGGGAVHSAVKSTALSSRQLHRAALLARLSGLCYYPGEQLEERLAGEGMKLVVSGATKFTQWYVADGVLDRWGQETSTSSSSGGSSGGGGSSSGPPVERVILFRGVVWRSSEVDAWRLWRDLMRFWPAAFAADLTEPKGALMAHAGVAEMAEQLYEPMRVPVTEARELRRRTTFGGHSLGGSLALLLAALCKLRLQLPAAGVRGCSFGSPPVLSHAGGSGGPAALKALGMPPGALRSFVLENDPVPRALLAADPTFAALKRTAAGDALLRLRQWALGPGVPLTPTRFLADSVGDLHLLRWTPEAGHLVIPLAPEEAEQQLIIPTGGGGSTLQGVLDHAHGSYSLDLDAAARQLERRGL